MNDFVSSFWGFWIAAVSIIGIVGVTWLLLSQDKVKIRKGQGGKVADTGHEWDGIRELNNPLPRWWFWLFIITVVFAAVYLWLYPGLGAYQGALSHTIVKEHDADRAAMEKRAAEYYGKFLTMDPRQVAEDPKALEIGQRLFLNSCAQCHGSDAGGSRSFPNLADNDWLGGDGSPEYIRDTILKGRTGVMPGFSQKLSGSEVKDVANYVRSLSGLSADPIRVALGRDVYKANCAACHGADGKGNTAVGAPNLTDRIWLYGSSEAVITESILKGRSNHMPAHEDILTPEKVHMLSAYVWSLSNGKSAATK